MGPALIHGLSMFLKIYLVKADGEMVALVLLLLLADSLARSINMRN